MHLSTRKVTILNEKKLGLLRHEDDHNFFASDLAFV